MARSDMLFVVCAATSATGGGLTHEVHLRCNHEIFANHVVNIHDQVCFCLYIGKGRAERVANGLGNKMEDTRC